MSAIVTLDIYQSAGIGVAALLFGMYLTKHVPFLKRYCIPAPVSGGIIVSLISLVLYYSGIECSFDSTIKDLCMMLFFTAVGFQSDLKVLRQGGRPLLIMILLVAVLIVFQNLISVGIARGLDLDPLFGMAAGSIPMSGGHGTSGGFSPLLEQLGLKGASSITMTAATFGLVAGSLLGGPLGERLIRKNNLAEQSGSSDTMRGIEASVASPDAKETQTKEASFRDGVLSASLLLITMALGTGLSKLLNLTGITFPTYFGSLIMACILRNAAGLSPQTSKIICMGKIVSIGDICLQLFLGMAMASLRLWELASLALPLCLILLTQVTFMAVYSAFIAFPLLGRDYDSAVLVSGLCGFGLGATPNAMANMSAVCYKYHYAVNPFIIIPIIGVMFADLINTGVITIFLNVIH
jgi:ESS family glutamate:Na+ symporter